MSTVWKRPRSGWKMIYKTGIVHNAIKKIIFVYKCNFYFLFKLIHALSVHEISNDKVWENCVIISRLIFADSYILYQWLHIQTTVYCSGDNNSCNWHHSTVQIMRKLYSNLLSFPLLLLDLDMYRLLHGIFHIIPFISLWADRLKGWYMNEGCWKVWYEKLPKCLVIFG